MNVAITDIRTPELSPFWYNVGANLKRNGHDVYYFDPRRYFIEYLKIHGDRETIVRFETNISEPVPEDDDSYVREFLLDHVGVDRCVLERDYANFLTALELYDIDLVVFWNEVDVGVIAAQTYDVPAVFMENGYLAKTLQIDDSGVNCNSSLADRSYDEICSMGPRWGDTADIETAIDATETLSPLERVRCMLYSPVDDTALQHTKNAVADTLTAIQRKQVRPGDDTLPDGRYLFVPFQVEADTQVLYNAPYVDSMGEFLSLVVEARDAVDEDLSIVVKEHPADIGKTNHQSLRMTNPEITWLKDYPIDEVIENAAVVMTLNSSVGFQAMAAENPVVTLGDTLYNNHPSVFHARSASEVTPALSNALAADIDPVAVDEYVTVFRENIFADGGFGGFDTTTLEQVLGYLERVGGEAA